MHSDQRLHIVSFDNPYPADYGGVIDVFYKIKHLHALGVKIVLHAFEYGRPPQKELENYCERVYYYKRKKIANPFLGLPYIVASRSSDKLLQRLLENDAPILFEGLHTCLYLTHPLLKQRKKLVRMHNIEHDYYQNLREVETSLIKRIFFNHESKRLLRFENVLHKADHILAISTNDTAYLSSKYKNVKYITAFHANDKVTAQTGRGDYALYHGKLSVGENDEAARFLVEQVFNKTDKPLYIAGYNPSDELRRLVEQTTNVKLFDNLNTTQISQMIAGAQVNVLPTFQSTGIKLKLINVLYQGRFVVANTAMIENTGCEKMCSIANTPNEFLTQINTLFSKPFSSVEVAERSKLLADLFDNASNAKQLVQLI